MNNLGSALLILPIALIIGGMAVPAKAWLFLVILGVAQFGLPYYLFSRGLKRVPAYQAALITLVEPILVPVWTYLALGEKVPRETLIGGGIILLALIVFVWTVSRRRAEPVEAHP
jgi:drug/metabolite transporter (DMT)-like permease